MRENVTATSKLLCCTTSAPPYIGVFDPTEYEFDINIYSPNETVEFEALFIIHPNVTVEYLSFDIIMMDEMVGESTVDGDFLINGTTPPLVIQAPFQSMYMLTVSVSTDSVLNTSSTMDITFSLLALVSIESGITETLMSNVTLHQIDPCNECDNVLNSTCEPQLDGSVNCICPTGYNGTNCDNYIGGCIPNPCMNNGSCQDILGNFTCSCPSPLSGRLCEVDTVNDCDTVFNPCANNGTCMDNINGYSCVCADGFTSTNCTVDIDDCDPNPCMNGGSCEDLINDYDCQCVSGYAGSDCNSKGCSTDIDKWGLEWPSTVAGNNATYDCYMSTAIRICMENSEWSLSNVDDCQTESYKSLEMRLMGNINATTLIEYTSELSNLTNTLLPILPQDIITASNILNTIINLALNIDNPDKADMRAIAYHATTILNNLLNENNNISFEEPTIKESGAVGEMLLLNSKRVGQVLARSLDRNSTGLSSFTVERNNIAFDARLPVTTTLGTHSDIQFPGETRLNYSEVRDTAQIVIPAVIIDQFSSEVLRPPVITVIIKNINSKLSNNMNRRSPLDITLCSQISNDPISTIQPVDDATVEIYFRIEDMNNGNFSAVCTFWDVNLIDNSKGGWSTSGVTTSMINSSYVQCTASHLACFAVLSDASGTSDRETTMDDDGSNDSVILYIGCGILILFLLLTIVVLLIFRKVFNQIKDFIHFNISLSFLLSSIIFIVGNEAINKGSVPCIILGVLLHYTLLSAFCWMLCEGILIYILLYHVFYEGFFRKWIFFMILGWGIPAPIVGISIGIFSHKEYETDEACWLSEDDHAIWGFIVPVALIILVFYLTSIVFLWKIYKTDTHYLTDTREKKFNMAKDLLKAKMFLLPILSSAWIVGLFAVNRSSIVYSYAFAILKIFQGIFVFSFYIILPYVKLIHNKDYDDDDYDDNVFVDNEVRVEEDRNLRGYRFSFSPGIAGKKVTIRRATSSKVARKKVPELVRRQSLSEYNETIRNEYTSSSTKKEEQSIIKSSNQFNTIVEEPEDQKTSKAKVKATESTSTQGNDLALQSNDVLKDEIEFENTKL